MKKVNSLSKKKQEQLLQNTFNVSEIVLHEDVQHNCPLGEQVGVTHYEMHILPGKQLAELIQLHWDIMDMMGKTFTLESGAAQVLGLLLFRQQIEHHRRFQNSRC